MADDFDVEKYLSPPKITSLNLASGYTDKEELTSEIKMGAFLQDIGVAGNDDIQANMQAAKSIYNQTTSKGVWSSVKEGWNNNQIQLQIADMGLAGLDNQLSPDEVKKQAESLQKL